MNRSCLQSSSMVERRACNPKDVGSNPTCGGYFSHQFVFIMIPSHHYFPQKPNKYFSRSLPKINHLYLRLKRRYKTWDLQLKSVLVYTRCILNCIVKRDAYCNYTNIDTEHEFREIARPLKLETCACIRSCHNYN